MVSTPACHAGNAGSIPAETAHKIIIMKQYTLDNENHAELCDDVDETVRIFCNAYKISGELAWLVIHNLATAKLEQFKGNQK